MRLWSRAKKYFLQLIFQMHYFCILMRKKKFILFCLWLAFSLVMGHNIVPHHHHEEDMVNAPGGHHHNDEDDNDLADFFSHFAHASYTTTVTYVNCDQHIEVVKKKTPVPATIVSYTLFSNNEFYIPPHSPDWEEFAVSSEHSLRLPSRAPPLS